MPANETLDDLVRRMTTVRIVVEQQNFHDSVLRSCDSGTAKKNHEKFSACRSRP